MAQPHSPHGNRPITAQQKQTLVAAYQRTGNMSQAMREANIRSPRTAYLWWRRYCEADEAGLQSRTHARHTQKRLPETLIEEMCQLRRQHPAWGRRQISDALTERHGRRVAGPSSVEAALRRAGLWEQVARPKVPALQSPQAFGIPAWLGEGINYGRLLAAAQTGIRLSIQSDARAATQVLYQQVWRPLEADPSLWSHLLAMPVLGSWLLSSRLHLGHSLMNSGHWPQAAHYLRETIDWMQEHSAAPRQRAYEETSQFVSLRRDDVWLGCYLHLGLVLGKGKREISAGLAYLQTALNAAQRPHRPVIPGDTAMLGDLERDLAHLKLRLRRFPEAEIHQHLQRAQEKAEVVGYPGIQAFTHIAWARLHDRMAREAGIRERATRQRQRALIEQALNQAIQLVEGEQEDRPMRQTICFVDAAQLSQAHGLPMDGQRVRRAAVYCLDYGYSGQARHLLAIPGIHRWLSEETLQNLTNVSRAE